MSFGKLILDYFDSLIRESEIEILKTNQWLNDAVIGFYFEYLSNHSHDKIAFYGPAVTQLLKMLPDIDEVKSVFGEIPESTLYCLWPVNDSSDVEKGSSGSHWSLLVFSRPDNKFLHFDSLVGRNEDAARKLYGRVSPLIGASSSFHPVEECIAQDNGRDCGLHVLGNAKLIKEFTNSNKKAEGQDSPLLWKNGLTTVNPKQADGMRGELLQLIKSLSQV